MAIRLYRAYSPGTRSKSVSYFDDLSKVKPEKSLTVGKKACGGRNNRGVITVKGRGGGHKRKYRMIDFHRKSNLLQKLQQLNTIQIEMQESLYYIIRWFKKIYCFTKFIKGWYGTLFWC